MRVKYLLDIKEFLQSKQMEHYGDGEDLIKDN